jgi:hypothetical protein
MTTGRKRPAIFSGPLAAVAWRGLPLMRPAPGWRVGSAYPKSGSQVGPRSRGRAAAPWSTWQPHLVAPSAPADTSHEKPPSSWRCSPRRASRLAYAARCRAGAGLPGPGPSEKWRRARRQRHHPRGAGQRQLRQRAPAKCAPLEVRTGEPGRQGLPSRLGRDPCTTRSSTLLDCSIFHRNRAQNCCFVAKYPAN